MSGCSVTINRGDKGTKYVTVLGTDDHEVARELALEEMGWTQADCAAIIVNPKSEDEPNHPTTIEVPVHHEPIPPSPENFVPRDQQEVPTETDEPNFHQEPPSDEVAETLEERDNPGETLNFGAGESEN